MGALNAILRLDGGSPSIETLLRMAAAAPHRGRNPSTYVSGPLALAHQRNSASVADPQPYVTDGGRLAVVLSGRLYNLDELASKLRQLGHSVGDGHCSAIAAAYDAWGVQCVKELDGDFAFVLYDARNRRLLGARDAIGVKPLCYAHWNSSLWLASEPAQILEAGVPADPCETSISSYIALERSLIDASLSFHRDIRRLKPGHIVVQEGTGPAREEPYWRIDPVKKIEETSETDIAARVRDLLIDSVRRRTPSEGPYACELSGGFDSSTVAALLRRELERRKIDTPIETFSFELRDQAADEPELIKAVAKSINARHHHIYVDTENAFNRLPQIQRAGGQPQVDMGLLYLWRCKEETARHGVHVTMSGLGGDELFFGRYHYLADLLRSGRFIEFTRDLMGLFPIDRSTGKPSSLQRLTMAYIASPLIPRNMRFALRKLQGRPVVPPWVNSSLARRTNLAERILQGPERVYSDYYRQDCLEVFNSILVNIALPMHEALGAIFDVDTRFPLLDRRIVEYLFAAPRELKIQHGHTRILQRKAMEGILPSVVTQEHLKKNFNPVLWRQQHEHFLSALKPFMSQQSFRIADYIDVDWLRSTYEAFVAGRAPGQTGYLLWYAFNLEIWLQAQGSSRETIRDGIPAA
ncbi:asparagine synthase (glutamine-hydrolyzing) [Microvirga guangxiensis]|uniref:asparagine synthase (glutamine-hydrolyzing) n=2 Tax=Microvirga guangxiensis TaxID=549386 RepID=A0A1G5GZB6_9HYPH|nr:asparagine synthase (glutamine-hydrolyzing) [Microvirga guangxiensis]